MIVAIYLHQRRKGGDIMSENLLITILGLAGSAIGSLVGIIINSKMTSYRIEQLEKKVEKHNNMIDRMYSAEKKIEVLEERQSVTNDSIDDMENDIHEINNIIMRKAIS